MVAQVVVVLEVAVVAATTGVLVTKSEVPRRLQLTVTVSGCL